MITIAVSPAAAHFTLADTERALHKRHGLCSGKTAGEWAVGRIWHVCCSLLILNSDFLFTVSCLSQETVMCSAKMQMTMFVGPVMSELMSLCDMVWSS